MNDEAEGGRRGRRHRGEHGGSGARRAMRSHKYSTEALPYIQRRIPLTEVLSDEGLDLTKLPSHRRLRQTTHFGVVDEVLNSEDLLFAATATDKLQELKQEHRENISELVELRKLPEEIPFDAVVINLSSQQASARHNKYRKALGKLILLDSAAVKEVLQKGIRAQGRVPQMSGVIAPRDSDYDVVRKAYASALGMGVVRFGLSLRIDPTVEELKLQNFRPVQDYLFKTHKLFLEPVVYGRGKASEMVRDLAEHRIQIAELPPIAAGRALAEGLEPLKAIWIDGEHSYESVFIRLKKASHGDSIEDFAGRTLAVGTPNSTSAYNTPLYYLTKGKPSGLADFKLFELPDYEQIISAVADGKADIGVLPKFFFNKSESSRMRAIELIGAHAGHVSSPMGLYVVSPSVVEHLRLRSLDELRGLFDPLNGTGPIALRPAFGARSPANEEKLVDMYRWAHPPDNTLLILMCGVGGLVVVGVICFLVWFQPETGTKAVPTDSRRTSERRFAVALSFPGEHRRFVARIAKAVSARIGRDCVFYDKYYEAELSRPDLDEYLRSVYSDQSELLVVFFCRDYELKDWCGVEWRVVRDLIKRKRGHEVMPIRLDDGEAGGFLSIDGYASAVGRQPEEIASLIIDRLGNARATRQSDGGSLATESSGNQ